MSIKTAISLLYSDRNQVEINVFTPFKMASFSWELATTVPVKYFAIQSEILFS